MKVFISWSGDTSKAVATALADWIPLVINAIEPFMSDGSLEPGQRWQNEISSQLEETSFGLVCVTRDNQSSPWLNFESGALAKKIEESRLVPVVYGLELAEVGLPLGQFNGVRLDAGGVSKLMRSMHAVSNSSVKAETFEKALAKWLPDLEDTIAAIPAPVAPAVPVRTDRELLLEILDWVRGISREAKGPVGWDDYAKLLHELDSHATSNAVRTFTRKNLRPKNIHMSGDPALIREISSVNLSGHDAEVLQLWLDRSRASNAKKSADAASAQFDDSAATPPADDTEA